MTENQRENQERLGIRHRTKTNKRKNNNTAKISNTDTTKKNRR